MLLWRIYYGDGTTFDNLDGEPADAPPWNVQAVVQRDPDVGRSISRSNDFYVWHNGQWWEMDLFGLIDYLIRTGLVKFGRTLGNRDYAAVLDRAVNDPDFPAKSAWHKLERRAPDD